VIVKFEKAIRKRAKLRLALTGPSGSGKTFGALIVAKGLGGKIAVIDSEHGSASLYSHLVDFDTLQLDPPYSPERYIAAIKAAEQDGYDVIVVDSTTHEWSGSGGCLELNEQTARAKFGGNTWSAWNDTTPRHRAFIDAMLQANAHVIATGRSKTETAQTEGPNGKKKVVKLGMKTEQRDGFEYEFTVVLDLIHDGHFATASKDRTGIFAGDPKPISEETGKALAAWLESGAEPPKEPEILGPQVVEDWQNKLRAAVDATARADVYRQATQACEAAKDRMAYSVVRATMRQIEAALSKEPA
jgi:hypothetical protein